MKASINQALNASNMEIVTIFEVKTGKNKSKRFIVKRAEDGTTIVYSKLCKVNANGIAQSTGAVCEYDSRFGY